MWRVVWPATRRMRYFKSIDWLDRECIFPAAVAGVDNDQHSQVAAASCQLGVNAFEDRLYPDAIDLQGGR